MSSEKLCGCITKSGEPCKNRVSSGTFCHLHLDCDSGKGISRKSSPRKENNEIDEMIEKITNLNVDDYEHDIFSGRFPYLTSIIENLAGNEYYKITTEWVRGKGIQRVPNKFTETYIVSIPPEMEKSVLMDGIGSEMILREVFRHKFPEKVEKNMFAKLLKVEPSSKFQFDISKKDSITIGLFDIKFGYGDDVDEDDFPTPKKKDYDNIQFAINALKKKDYVTFREMVLTKKINPRLIHQIINEIPDEKVGMVLFESKKPIILEDSAMVPFVKGAKNEDEEDEMKYIASLKVNNFITDAIIKATESNNIELVKMIVKKMNYDENNILILQHLLDIAKFNKNDALIKLFNSKIQKIQKEVKSFKPTLSFTRL